MQNENWRGFKERIYGSDYMIWHDGVADCTYELSREDPAHVKQMILEGLAEEDYVAAEALKQVNLPELFPDLRKKVLQTRGKFQIELATYLQQKDPEVTDDRYAKLVIHELLHPTYIMRMDSAILLRHFPAEYVSETLLDRVANDPDYYVRYHSGDSYLRVNNLKPNEIFAYEDIFPLILDAREGESGEAAEARHKNASEKLRALVEGRQK